MEMERQRQAHSKEIESKDEEVDEIRRSCGKKVGTLQSWVYSFLVWSSLIYSLTGSEGCFESLKALIRLCSVCFLIHCMNSASTVKILRAKREGLWCGLCGSPYSWSHLLTFCTCPAAETDGGAAGGGVRRQAKSAAREKRAGVQTAEHPGQGCSFALHSLCIIPMCKSASTHACWRVCHLAVAFQCSLVSEALKED